MHFRAYKLVVALLLAAAASAADVSSLTRVLLDPAVDARAKGEACEQLMEMGARAAPAVPALTKLLVSKETILRDYAVTTLTKIGAAAKPALAALRKLADSDESSEIRSLARETIQKIDLGATATTEPPKAPAMPKAATPAPKRTASSRPPLMVRRGHYFQWAMPLGWQGSWTANGVTLVAPDHVMSVSSALLLRSFG